MSDNKKITNDILDSLCEGDAVSAAVAGTYALLYIGDEVAALRAALAPAETANVDAGQLFPVEATPALLSVTDRELMQALINSADAMMAKSQELIERGLAAERQGDELLARLDAAEKRMAQQTQDDRDELDF